jgi:hypothetical protein
MKGKSLLLQVKKIPASGCSEAGIGDRNIRKAKSVVDHQESQ